MKNKASFFHSLTDRSVFLFFILVLTIAQFKAFGQESLKELIQKHQEARQSSTFASDTQTVQRMLEISKKLVFDHPDSSYHWAQQGLALAESQAYTRGIIMANYRMGIAYYIKSNYYPAIQLFLDGLKLSQDTEDQALQADGFKNISLIYLGQHQYEDAIHELHKAMALNQQRNDTSRLANNYFNIAISFDELGSYDSALYYLDKALAASVASDNHQIKIMSYNRLGETYYHMGEYDRALHYYQLVLHREIFQSQWEDCFAHAGLGQTYLALKKYDPAVEHATRSYHLAREMKAHWDTERALRILAGAYEAREDFREAYHYHKLYKAYSDSIYDEAKEKEINFLHLQQKESENRQLAQENKISRQRSRFNQTILMMMSLLALSLMVMVGIVYYNNRQKHRLNQLLQQKNQNIAAQNTQIEAQNRSLQDMNASKDQLFSVISHDLKSPFASIMGTFELIRKGLLSQEEQDAVLKELNLKVSHVFDMLNNLLYWANSQQKGIQANMLKVDLPDVVEEVLTVSHFLATEKNISIKHSNPAFSQIFADPDHVRIMVQNLVGNAIKFTPKAGTITIDYTVDAQNLQIHVRDSGVGIAPEQISQILKSQHNHASRRGTNNEKGTGLGLLLVRRFAEINQAELQIQSTPGEGSDFSICFRKWQPNTEAMSGQRSLEDEIS